MTLQLAEVADFLLDRINDMTARPEVEAGSMTPEEIVEALYWLSAVNYGAAVQLTRLHRAGVDLRREDGKDIDRWTAEQVSLGNIARRARIEFERRAKLEP